jgi:bifunctional non-homologous end joining protein LigD
MSLREYRRKRDFAKTPEPKGTLTKPKTDALRFVVHRHHASRLHWDVRLEMDGALASWAVPQGPPLEGGQRRLAVHTEDHPMQYLTFHGVIPDGYGAGAMTIWDTGTYSIDERKPKELKVTFSGAKLGGSYVLVQTAQNDGRDWLMIKHETAPKVRALDARIIPMLATPTSTPFDSPEWAFEPKWDGVRTIAFVDGAVVRLQSRNLRDVTAHYPEVELSCGHALTGAYRAILDGEIVAVDAEGRPSFQLLQPRMHANAAAVSRLRRQGPPIFYYVFDLLWVDGEDLTARALRERAKRLREVLQAMGAVRLSEAIPTEGTALFEAVKTRGLEGIIAKRFDAPYVQGRSALWLKVKAKRTTDCVIGGWTEGQGGREKALGALLLGVYEEAGAALRYVGHVGSGFDDTTLRTLLGELRPRETKRNPFTTVPKPNAPVHYVRPELVCTVEFTEWTAEGILRQPSYKGLRQDIDPKECRGEEREADPKTATRRAAEEVRSRAPEGVMPKLVPALLEVGGRELRLTNLDKVLFPEDGYTKADLIRYYIEASAYLLPYLKDRPLTLKPFPDGIHGTRFYQKEKPGFTPAWVQTWRGWSDVKQAEIEYVLCNDLPTLVWLANYTAIEMHPWLSRVDDPGHPDFVMVDLDPQPGAAWESVKRVARVVGEDLAGRRLRSFPKTTGSRGIHVLVPVARRYTFEQVRSFVQEIAANAYERLPQLVTREWQKAKRGPRVMIDYLQNRSGATTAGPYSVRPKPGAPISMPFEWDELETLAGSEQFSFANVRERLADAGDLLAPAYGLEQRL